MTTGTTKRRVEFSGYSMDLEPSPSMCCNGCGFIYLTIVGLRRPAGRRFVFYCEKCGLPDERFEVYGSSGVVEALHARGPVAC